MAITNGAEPWRLTDAQVAQFERDGYLLIRAHASAEECDALVQRSKEIVARHNVLRDGSGTFETAASTSSEKNGQGKGLSRDAYFLGSAYTTRVFFEPGVLERPKDEHHQQQQQQGALGFEKVNKIGHALHELDDLFESFSTNEKVRSVVRALGYKRAVVPQSMVIVKAPHIGGAVATHRDCTFLRTEPKNTCLGFWWALEPAMQANGCLWALPGSHKDPKSGERISDLQFVRVRAAEHEYSAELDRTEMRGTVLGDFDHEAGWVPLECEKGDLVLIDGSLLHKSAPNTSKDSRFAYSIHVFDDTESSRWSTSNWLQRDPGMPPFRAL